MFFLTRSIPSCREQNLKKADFKNVSLNEDLSPSPQIWLLRKLSRKRYSSSVRSATPADTCSLSLSPPPSFQVQQFKSQSLIHKPEKVAAVPGPPGAPPASSSSSSSSSNTPVRATAPPRKEAAPPSSSQPLQALSAAGAGPAVKEQGLPLADGTGGKEQYGYIVTNQRWAV